MKQAYRATRESRCHVCRTGVLGELVVEASKNRIVHLRCHGEMTDRDLIEIPLGGTDPREFERPTAGHD